MEWDTEEWDIMSEPFLFLVSLSWAWWESKWKEKDLPLSIPGSPITKMCNQRGYGAQQTGWRPPSFLCSSSFSHSLEVVKHSSHQVPFSLWCALPADYCSFSLVFDSPDIIIWLLKEDFSLFFSPFKGPFKPRPCLSSEAVTLRCMALSPSHLTVYSGAGNWSELSFFHIWVGFQRQPKVVKEVWSSGATPEMHGPTSECLDLIEKTPWLPIPGLV